MRSRLLTLMLALVVGAIATVLVYMYVQRVEDRSTQGMQTRNVLVASRSFPAGTTGADIFASGGTRTQEMPIKYVAPGALSSEDQLAAPGLTLANDLAAGEQLTSARFQESPSQAFLTQFPENTEALSLPLDYVRAVSGHVQAGDRVNAYVTGDASKFKFRVKVQTDSSGTPKSFTVGGDNQSTFLLLSELPVIEVLGTDPSQQASTATMTLAVSGKEAASLISAQETAQLWFTLVPEEGEAE
jgi:Flp pilus assembly protein CpaB